MVLLNWNEFSQMKVCAWVLTISCGPTVSPLYAKGTRLPAWLCPQSDVDNLNKHQKVERGSPEGQKTQKMISKFRRDGLTGQICGGLDFRGSPMWPLFFANISDMDLRIDLYPGFVLASRRTTVIRGESPTQQNAETNRCKQTADQSGFLWMQKHS